MCPCGFVHNLSPIPDDGFRIISDRDLDVAESLDDLHLRCRLMYECPECNRLMWQKTIHGTYEVYVRDPAPVWPD